MSTTLQHPAVRRTCSLAMLLWLLPAALMTGAVGAQDVQVPFDRDSTLYEVDADLRAQLGLFPDVPGYQGAELYRVADTTYELVIRYRAHGRLRRERRSLNPAEVQSLRDRIGQARSARAGPSSAEDGRYGLVAATTFHGLVEGSLVAGAVGAEGERILTLPLLGGAAGFFGPLLGTRNARVTEGEADMAFYGGVQGYLHATQLAGLAGGENLDGQVLAGGMALGGAVEGIIAYRIARARNWPGGHAEMVSFTGLGGNLVGLGLSAALIGDEGEDAPRLVSGMSLLGSVAGAYLGHRMGRTGRYTEGDARVYLQSAVQGVNLMGSFLSLRDEGAVRPTALLLTGAAVGGAMVGRRLVRHRDFTGTESVLVGLGSVTGSLAGLALTLEVEDGSSRAIAQGIGAAAGFGVTYAVLADDARQRAASSSAVDLRLRVQPTLVGARLAPEADRSLAPQVAVTASF